MRTSRWPARLLATAGTAAVLTTALTVAFVPASHADVQPPRQVFEVTDGVGWH